MCLRCERSDIQCPGYRDLDEVTFRDESAKISKRLCPVEYSSGLQIQATCSKSLQTGPSGSRSRFRASQLRSTSIPHSLCPAIDDLGANFFFAKYSFNEEPFFSGYHDWLAKSYLEDKHSHVLRPVVEAVGLAGLSNIFYTAQFESKSKQQYCTSLAALKQVLNDPAQVAEDTTLMAVILLILFEVYWTTTFP